LVAGLEGGPYDVGTRAMFADLGQTVADLLGADADGLEGRSFVDLLGIERSS
jgi:phosphopentomutase